MFFFHTKDPVEPFPLTGTDLPSFPVRDGLHVMVLYLGIAAIDMSVASKWNAPLWAELEPSLSSVGLKETLPCSGVSSSAHAAILRSEMPS